jgi:hypothetical protein
MRTVQDIQHEIDRLTEEREEVREREKGPWPRRITVYATLSQEQLQHVGNTAGLSVEAAQTFRRYYTVIPVIFETQRDGTARMVEVSGVAL